MRPVPASIVLASLILASCADSPGPTAYDGDTGQQLTPLAAAANQTRMRAVAGTETRSFETEILKAEAMAPGLGGIFYEPEENALVAYMVPGGSFSRAAAALENLSSTKIIAPSGEAVSPRLVVRPGAFAFSELVAWSDALVSEIVDLEGFLSIDADERLNRVRVGVADSSTGEKVRSTALEIGIPLDAIHIEQGVRLSKLVAPPRSGNLRSRIRPAGSGVEIRNELGQRCSYGWTVTNQSQVGMITAAHCSRYASGNGSTGEGIYQNQVTGGDLIGYVSVNPTWNVSGCSYQQATYSSCTESDVMWIPAQSASSVEERVANTGDYQYNNNTRGSVGISSWYVVNSNTGENAGQIVATSGRKVGRTTGYTGGPIAGTCETHPVDGSLYLCVNRLTGASVGSGDSGGPVFGYIGQAIAFGITVAGGPLNQYDSSDGVYYCAGTSCTLLYTPVDQIEQHLGMTFSFGS